VLGRAVYSRIEIGDIDSAYSYVRTFPLAQSRAEYLAIVSAAFADVKRVNPAVTALKAAQHELPNVVGERKSVRKLTFAVTGCRASQWTAALTRVPA
jgi:hypothetical protein